MRNNPHPLASRLTAGAHKIRYVALLVAAGSHLASLGSAQAGAFFSDFNSGSTPAGSTLYDAAVIEGTGGFTNSGCVKLTKAVGSVQGGYIINDLDAGQPVVGFTA